MNPVTRSRLEKSVEYHESVSKFYKELAGLQEDEPLPEDEDQHIQPGDRPERAIVEASGESSSGNGNGNDPRSSRDMQEQEDKEKQRKADLGLAKTHAEVVRQIREIIDREPVEPAINVAQRDQQILRDPAFNLRPTAGRFH